MLALNGLSIGTWELDFVARRISGDAMFARLFGVTPDEAQAGISLEQFAAAFHPEDRALIQKRHAAALEGGGVFVLEHRTEPAPGIQYRVLARGRFERDESGIVTRGHGICVDITDLIEDGQTRGPLHVRVSDGQADAIDQFTDQALRLWELLDGLEVPAAERLRPLMRALLIELGRQLAQAELQTSTRRVSKEDMH
ncbi:PAS domain-containing protein [Methylobacterium fujisawaense]|uniref:PAS domain-containing protein n=1 Tax=Methylobacterium fujisawaense TaxID=107400 RepID=UPI002F35CECD